MAKNNEVAVQQNDQSTALMKRPEIEQFVTPFADVYETFDAFVVFLDMPGATKESIAINIERGKLMVKGTVATLRKENASLLYKEIPGLGFYRAFNLGEEINPSNVDAQYENGVLTIRLHKREELKPREIAIK